MTLESSYTRTGSLALKLGYFGIPVVLFVHRSLSNQEHKKRYFGMLEVAAKHLVPEARGVFGEVIPVIPADPRWKRKRRSPYTLEEPIPCWRSCKKRWRPLAMK